MSFVENDRKPNNRCPKSPFVTKIDHQNDRYISRKLGRNLRGGQFLSEINNHVV